MEKLPEFNFYGLSEGFVHNKNKAQMYVLSMRLFKLARAAVKDNLPIFFPKTKEPTHSRIEQTIDQAQNNLDRMGYDQLNDLDHDYRQHPDAVKLAKKILNRPIR